MSWGDASWGGRQFLASERRGEWVELPATEECGRCWRRYAGWRVRAHIRQTLEGFEWCASREKELPIRWFTCDSLMVAMAQAEEFCELIPEIGPMQDLTPGDW